MDGDVFDVPSPGLEDHDDAAGANDKQFLEFIHSIARDEDPAQGLEAGCDWTHAFSGAPAVIPLPPNASLSGMFAEHNLLCKLLTTYRTCVTDKETCLSACQGLP
jgi:hypothetical protein